jgi:glyoxylase-like metal-dependent hydrolase (beta-lactamase superfamily II)
MIELGEVRVHLLSDGVFALDGGAMFGVVPRVLWEKHDPPDERHRVSLGLNVPLIEAGGQRILVDTGMGDKWNAKEQRMYRLDRSVTLLDGLARLGLDPEDIDVVVNSHLHFDHAGGNTRLVDGRPVPTFPRARYLVQKGEWEDATHPHERNRASYQESSFVPMAEHGQLELVEGEVEIAPGVHVVPVGGHTAHHQMIRVEGGGRTLVVPTDILPTASHLPLAYIMSYDLYPVGTLEAKRGLLRQVAEEGWQIVFYHDPRTPVGGVKVSEGRYVLNGESL